MASVTGGVPLADRLRISSLNTGGLSAAIKRTKVMTHIKKLNADIMFLRRLIYATLTIES